MIVTKFEASLSAVISLVAYMPMLMGTGGNTGSQAATLIIRGLATGEVETKDCMKILWKEIRIGVIIGVILSALNFARVVFIDHNSVMIACTVCAAMVFIVIFAKVIGSMVGQHDVFGESGKPDELREKYGMTAADIVNAVRGLY